MINYTLSLIAILIVNCTGSPSGAIEYNTTIYYLNDRFHEDIPEDYIFHVNALNGGYEFLVLDEELLDYRRHTSVQR